MKVILLICFALLCFAQARTVILSKKDNPDRIITSVSSEDEKALDHAVKILLGEGTEDEMDEFIDYMINDDEKYTSAEKIRGILHNQILKKKVVSALGSYVKR